MRFNEKKNIIHDLFNNVRRAINFPIKYKPSVIYYFYYRIASGNAKSLHKYKGENSIIVRVLKQNNINIFRLTIKTYWMSLIVQLSTIRFR